MPEANDAKRPEAKIDMSQQTNPDLLLQELVGLVQGTNAEIGIILTVSGALVSGKLVSRHLYLEHFRTEVAKVCKDEGVIATIQSKVNEALASKMSEETPTPGQVYIHLKDAKFLYPERNLIAPGVTVWWRGRINEIDGFSLDPRHKSPYTDADI